MDEFRSTQPHRTKLPETVWQAAVELAQQHGVYSVAHPLRLDYTGLKKRLDGVQGSQKKAAKPAFVVLIADHAATMADCVIESSLGGKMRIHWKSSAGCDDADRHILAAGKERRPGLESALDPSRSSSLLMCCPAQDDLAIP